MPRGTGTGFEDYGRTRRVLSEDQDSRWPASPSHPLLAQMRSADRPRQCLLFGADQTYRGHHETDAFDPNRTFNGLLKPRRRSVWETRLLQRSNP